MYQVLILATNSGHVSTSISSHETLADAEYAVKAVNDANSLFTYTEPMKAVRLYSPDEIRQRAARLESSRV